MPVNCAININRLIEQDNKWEIEQESERDQNYMCDYFVSSLLFFKPGFICGYFCLFRPLLLSQSKQYTFSFRGGTILAHPAYKEHEQHQFEILILLFILPATLGRIEKGRLWSLVKIFSVTTSTALCWRNSFWSGNSLTT